MAASARRAGGTATRSSAFPRAFPARVCRERVGQQLVRSWEFHGGFQIGWVCSLGRMSSGNVANEDDECRSVGNGLARRRRIGGRAGLDDIRRPWRRRRRRRPAIHGRARRRAAPGRRDRGRRRSRDSRQNSARVEHRQARQFDRQPAAAVDRPVQRDAAPGRAAWRTPCSRGRRDRGRSARRCRSTAGRSRPRCAGRSGG